MASASSALGVSDADFLKLNPADYASAVEDEQDKEEELTTETTNDPVVEATDVAESKPDADGEAVAEGEDEDDEEDKEDKDEGGDKDKEVKVVKEPVADKLKDKTVEAVETAAEPDYKAAYERLLAPFKANGRDIQVTSVDEALTLMQMGANYNKKMAGMKPSLKVLKMLEANGLLDESKLSFLIDLEKKDPAAINKLVSDSGLDPMDLDAKKAGDYKPKVHSIDDRELALDEVLNEMESTSTFTRTLGVVTKEWDGSSKQTIAEHPQLLKIINDHMQSGIYDQISTEVERERMLGRLSGLSDLDAYRQVGDAIQKREGFNLTGGHQKEIKAAPEKVLPKPKQADSDELKDKKRSASSAKPGVATKPEEDFNPLALSDADFMKRAEARFK